MKLPLSLRLAALLCVSFLLSASRGSAELTVTLRTGDVFDMRLGGVPQEFAADFAFQYTIGPDGTINVPFIGEIKAAGLTAPQLERAVQTKLMAEKFFSRPTVLISVAQSARYVSISGGVRNPQRLSWNQDLTLSRSIGDCGNLGDFGHDHGIQIIRDGKVVGKYSLKDIRREPALDPKLLPGDQVIVPE